MAKTQTTIYTPDFPNLRKLVETHGAAEAATLLGLSDVSKMIAEGKVRPAYEMAAHHLRRTRGELASAKQTMVIQGTRSQMESIMILVNAIGLTAMELDL
jgi:hypothetical protein